MQYNSFNFSQCKRQKLDLTLEVPIFDTVAFGRFARFSELDVVFKVRLAACPALVFICGGLRLEVDGGGSRLRVVFSLILFFYYIIKLKLKLIEILYISYDLNTFKSRLKEI